jgi:hypothetical protein
MNQEAIELAVELFTEQRNKLKQVRAFDYRHPDFKLWQDSTASLFQRFIRPDSPHFIRFRDIRFRGQAVIRGLPFNYRGPVPRTDGVSPEDKEQFERGCAEADNCIHGAIDEIATFGVHVEVANSKTRQKRVSGVQQIFHGPVTIEKQVIATDNAIQNIGQIGDTGASLKEIADLLNQSLDLTGRQRLEALKGIEIIASETGKPEQHRNWKTIKDWADTVFDLAGKAGDVATKLAPHLPFLTALIHTASTKLGL